MDAINVTVISIQKPLSRIIGNTFAMSENVSYLLPEGFKAAVECDTAELAKNHFSRCKNRIRCDCGTSVHQCQCPQNWLTVGESNDYMLPLETPHEKILQSGQNILAISNEDEVTLKIESKLVKNSAELFFNQKCDIEASDITGCYNCPHGAQFLLKCTTKNL